MKKHLALILFLGYFGIFIILGVIFYYKFLDSYLSVGASPTVGIEGKNQIYYSEDNNLFKIEPDFLTVGAVTAPNRIQSTGEVIDLDISSDRKLLAYSSKNKTGALEIRLVDTSDNQSEQITDPSMKDFSDFTTPRLSPDSTKLAFLGKSAQKDSIFIKDLANSQILNLTSANTAKISSFSWNKTGDKIVYCASNISTDNCQITSLDLKTQSRFSGDITMLSWERTDEIFFVLSKDQTANVYKMPVGKQPVAITHVSSPKKVNQFSLDRSGQNMAYQIQDSSTNDVYFSKTSGVSNFQLTQDGQSLQPIISPDGDVVVYLKKDGLYTIDIDQNNEKKMLNLTGSVLHLLAWR